MRRLSIPATYCLLVLMAAPGALAGDAAAPPATESPSAWQWLRTRVFGAPGPAETAAQMLARRGGSRLRLEADTDALRAELADELRGEVRERMRKARIAFRDLAARDGDVEVRVRDVDDLSRAMAALAETTADVHDMGDGLIRLTPSRRFVDWALEQLFTRNTEIITRRLNALGIATAGVQREGNGAIAVLLPGVKDPAHVADVLARRGQLELRLVDESVSRDAAVKAGAPDGSEVLFDKTKAPYVVSKRAPLTSADIIEANASFAPDGKEPVVGFRLTEHGAQVFAHVTEDNVGRPFAIVLDGVVLSAPVIREPILHGSGQISGNFTVDQAIDLALMLRSGALAFGMTVVDARAVAPAQN